MIRKLLYKYTANLPCKLINPNGKPYRKGMTKFINSIFKAKKPQSPFCNVTTLDSFKFDEKLSKIKGEPVDQAGITADEWFDGYVMCKFCKTLCLPRENTNPGAHPCPRCTHPVQIY